MSELATRDELIRFYRRTAVLLESERQLFLRHLLSEKGLDPEKQYTLGQDGVLEERDG